MHADGPTQQGSQIARNRQTQAGAAELAMNAAVCLPKCLENHLLLMWRNAHAGVAHREGHGTALRREHPQRDFAFLGKFAGIRQQVLENLSQSLRIRLNLLRHSRLDDPGEAQMILLGGGLKCLDQRFHRGRHRDLLGRQFDLAGLDSR